MAKSAIIIRYMSKHTHILGTAFFLLSLSYAWMMLAVVQPESGDMLQGLVLRRVATDKPPAWVTITSKQTDSGATVPKHTNVIFHLPFDIARTQRLTLFGNASKEIRYWGYCFPDDYDPAAVQPVGLPGKVFLSEAERKWRAEREAANKPLYTIYFPPNQTTLSQTARRTIRHQVDSFYAGQTCYVMTDRELPIGTDRDLDGLNVQLEKQYETDPALSDTDSDGIADGVEVYALLTNPILRDTDSDGLIEGFEDRNRNGRVDPGETSPTNRDSDSDGLCDGLCRVSNTKKICSDYVGRECVELPYDRWEGEDKNLNGVLDANETNPLLQDSNGDGVLDDQEYYNCVMKGKTSC